MTSVENFFRPDFAAGAFKDKDAVYRWSVLIDERNLGIALNHLQIRTDGDSDERRARIFRCLTGDYAQEDYLPEPGMGDAALLRHRIATRKHYVETCFGQKTPEVELSLELISAAAVANSSYADAMQSDARRNAAGSRPTTPEVTEREPLNQIFSRSGIEAQKAANFAALNNQDAVPPELLMAPGKLTISVDGRMIQLDKSVADAVVAQYGMQMSQVPVGATQQVNTERCHTNETQSTRLTQRVSFARGGAWTTNENELQQGAIRRLPQSTQFEAGGCNFQPLSNANPTARGATGLGRMHQMPSLPADNFSPEVGGRDQRGGYELPLPGQDAAWSGRPGYQPSRYRTTGYTSSDTFAPHRIDIGNKVRKWNLKYNGEGDIDEFLTRVEECRILDGLTDDQVLAALSELMIGVPLYWVRQNRSKWTSWNDFKRDVVARFRKSIDFQTKIRREAERRTQGEGESVISYVTCIRTILEQFPRKMDEQAQIDLIFNNLHPEISRYLTRDSIGTVEGLMDKAQMAEGFLNIRAEYQPPPKPEESLMPQLAFDTVKTVKRPCKKRRQWPAYQKRWRTNPLKKWWHRP